LAFATGILFPALEFSPDLSDKEVSLFQKSGLMIV
jgi:hypothetical protein